MLQPLPFPQELACQRPIVCRSLVILALMVGLILGATGRGFGAEDGDQYFETFVRPLLAEHCWKCHGENEAKGDLRLDSLAELDRGGDSGAVLVRGDIANSLLLQAVRYEGFEMPPDRKLSDEQIKILERWVATGASWPDSKAGMLRERKAKISEEDRQWWAFRPLSEPTPPTDNTSVQPVDRFIRSKLSSMGMDPAPRANRIALVRRVSMDLIGLPPTPQEVREFLEDESDDAYSKLVEKLLASPRYGERWARHWLDLVRYADSDGYRIDHYRPNAWTYRDYVIRSFNEDKPYDRFIQEQIAGDEMFPNDLDAWIATGYLRHWIYEYNSRDARTQWTNILNDVTDTTGDVFLGLGLQCAKCHDHKFDPILQKDYYQLQAYFASILPIDKVVASEDQIKTHDQDLRVWEEETELIRKQIDELERPYREKAAAEAIGRFPLDVQAIANKLPSERTAYESQLSYLVYRQVDFEYARLEDKIKGENKERWIALKKELAKSEKRKPLPLLSTMSVVNTERQVPDVRIPKKSNEPIHPGTLTVLENTPSMKIEALAGEPSSQTIDSIDKDRIDDGAGRRTQLARWLSQPNHPLTSRVMVNRVWQYHFGRGLVANSSDFGKLGGEPSHPELLDWLSTQWVRNGWSFKQLHRWIVLSETYQQSTTHPEFAKNQQIDPANVHYWRADTRRLQAEQIRDSLLQVCGLLQHPTRLEDVAQLTGGGEGVQPDVPRRSVYTRVMRNARDPLLDAFDLPLFFSSESSRNTTTTPVQSLLLINSPQMIQYSHALAQGIWTNQSESRSHSSRLEALWWQVFSRPIEADELSGAEQFLHQQSKRIQDNNSLQQASHWTLGKIPYRDGQAISILPNKPATRVSIEPSPSMDTSILQGDFTVEAFLQVRSIYDNANVRTIASKWTGSSGKPGWGFGVTGKGSRRMPQTLVLQLWGKKRDGTFGEAALFSDQNIALEKPYFVAASVTLATDQPGTVTFYCKDLSNDDEPLQTITVQHEIAGGFENESPIVIGGRHQEENGLFDGWIDDLRMSSKALREDQILFVSEGVSDHTVGYWKFEPQPGLLEDSSENRLKARSPKQTSLESDPDFSAFRDLAHALLNSNEFLYTR